MWKGMVWTVHMPLSGSKFTTISKEKKIHRLFLISSLKTLPCLQEWLKEK